MSNYFENEKRERSREPHPAWRGIGFLMLIGIPILSFAIADQVLILVRLRGIAVPAQLQLAPVEIPIYGLVADLWAVLVFALIIAVALFGLFAVLNAVVYRSSSDSTYQVFESKPQRYKPKKKLYKPKYDE